MENKIGKIGTCTITQISGMVTEQSFSICGCGKVKLTYQKDGIPYEYWQCTNMVVFPVEQTQDEIPLD